MAEGATRIDDSNGAAARRGVWTGVAMAIAALPFLPHWLDFEVARRGLVLLIAGVSAIAAPRWLPRVRGGGSAMTRSLPAGSLWFLAFCALALFGCFGTDNPMEALFRTAYLGGLWVALVFGATLSVPTVARAALPSVVIVAGYGILQSRWIGLEWPAGYARNGQPVSTFGNLNYASEFVAVGLAIVAVAMLQARSRAALGRALPMACAIAAAYLGLNGSRSGLLALGLVGSVMLVTLPRGAWRSAGAAVRIALVAVLFVSAAIGWFGSPRSSASAPPPTVSTPATTTPSTIDVRLAIWRVIPTMLADAPLFGHGTGQFRYEYPRYRSDEELELSTFGRRFATFAADPHNDPLQILVEHGVIGATLWLLMWIAVVRRHWRSAAGWLRLAPIVGFAALSLVRSPLGNGPCALLMFLYLGAIGRRELTPDDDGTRAALGGPAAIGWRSHTPWFVTGVAFACVGIAVLTAQCSFALGVGADGRPASRAALDLAVLMHPSESRYRTQRVRMIRAEAVDAVAAFEAARVDFEHVRHDDPHNTTALMLLAETAHLAGRDEIAQAALAQILTLDPRHPEATLLAATRNVQRGEVAVGIATLYADPHPRLRAGLAEHLRELATAVFTTDPSGAALLRHEAEFIGTLDALIADARSAPLDPARLPQRIGDSRYRALYARQFVAQGEDAAADALAPARLDFGRAQRALLAPILDALDSLPRWRAARAAE